MSTNYRETLELNTKTITEALSKWDIDQKEKQDIIDAYTDELTRHMFDPSSLNDCAILIYSMVIKHIDKKLSLIFDGTTSFNIKTAKSIDPGTAKYEINYDPLSVDLKDAEPLCKQQKELIQLFEHNSWDLPALIISDPEERFNVIQSKQEKYKTICNNIARIDKALAASYENTPNRYSDETIVVLNDLLSKLEIEIKKCKANNFPVPKIQNSDPERIRKEIDGIMSHKEYIQKEITETDSQINSLLSTNIFNLDQCKHGIDLCKKQANMISECDRNKWTLPSLRFSDLINVQYRFEKYYEIINNDIMLSSIRNYIFNGYYIEPGINLCTSLIQDINICNANMWLLPVINNANPLELLQSLQSEKQKLKEEKQIRDEGKHTARIYGIFLIICIIIALIITIIKF